MHPFQPPLSQDPGGQCCDCQGFVCPTSCKRDAGACYLDDLRGLPNVCLLGQHRAVRLEASRRKIVSAVLAHNGQEIEVRGEQFVMALGALATPLLLMRSESDSFRSGIANSSGMVGRCLMRHFYDVYLIKPRGGTTIAPSQKEIYFTDFYHGETWLGIAQSFGPIMPAEVIGNSLWLELHLNRSRFAGAFAKTLPLVNRLLGIALRGRMALVSTCEDLPWEHNAVTLHPRLPGGQIHYRISDFDGRRLAEFRKKMTSILRPLSFRQVKLGEGQPQVHCPGERNLSHGRVRETKRGESDQPLP
jgi:choline dehydrogenase-like flavoprotein